MEEFEKIASVENIVEAEVLENMLKAQHIPYAMRSFHDSAYNGIYQLQKGWVYVSAPPRYRQRILEILDALRRAPQ